MAPYTPFNLVFNLFILITFIALLARRFRLPYTVVLVFAGLLIPFFPSLPLPDLSPEIFLSLLLPPFIFQAAYHLDFNSMIEEADTVLSYAFIGTLLSALLVGGAAYFLLKISLIEALVLGIMLSPTDPVAVISTFRTLGVSARFTVIIEGEALFNDGVAMVVYSSLLTAARTGELEMVMLLREIVFRIVGGGLIGIVAGFLIFRTIKSAEDPFVPSLLTLLSAYGIYEFTSIIQTSGVIAIIASGLMLKYMFNREGALRGEHMRFLDTFWEFMGFITTSIAFLFIGLYLDLNLMQVYLWIVLASILIILGARRLTIYFLGELLRIIRKKRFSSAWQNCLTWSGLRGALSIVLALGVVNLPLEHGQELLAISFGVVLFSVLFQGLSINSVVKRLGLVPKDSKP